MNRNIERHPGRTVVALSAITAALWGGHLGLNPAYGGEPYVVVSRQADVQNPGQVLGQLQQGQLVEVLQEENGRQLVEIEQDDKWVKGWVEGRHLNPYQYKVSDQVVSIRLVTVKQMNWYDSELWPGGWYEVQQVGRSQLFLSEQGPLNWVDRTAVLPLEMGAAHFDRLVRDTTAKEPVNRDKAAKAYANRAAFRLEVLAKQAKSREDTEAMLANALEDFRTSRDFNPNESMTHTMIGIVLKRQGNLDEAVASYTKAIEVNPKDSRAFNNRANIRKEQREYSKAIDDYVAAVRAYPRNVGAYNNLRMMGQTFAIVSFNNKDAITKELRDKYDAAVQDLAPVFENDPSLRGSRAYVGQ